MFVQILKETFVIYFQAMDLAFFSLEKRAIYNNSRSQNTTIFTYETEKKIQAFFLIIKHLNSHYTWIV